MNFQGSAVIVTGGAGGLGRAIAAGFVGQGARVALADINASEAAAVAASLGDQAISFQADVSRGDEVDALFAHVLHEFGRLDILVNNVAITDGGDAVDIEEALWDRVMAVNLKSYFLCAQRAARHWKATSRSGRIVNIGSIDAELPIPDRIPYCVSKAGVVALTRNLALAFAPSGIKVNAINPGLVATGMMTKAMADPNRQQELLGWQPAGRMAEASEIAEAVLYLASEAADFITGATLTIDGGRLLQYTL